MSMVFVVERERLNGKWDSRIFGWGWSEASRPNSWLWNGWMVFFGTSQANGQADVPAL